MTSIRCHTPSLTIAVRAFLFGMMLSSTGVAQLDGPRVYWPLPKNYNIIAVHGIFGTVNAAWSNWNNVQPTLQIQNSLYMLTYARSQDILGRTTWLTAVFPVGFIETNSSIPQPQGEPFAKGIADPSLSLTMNLIGAEAMTFGDWLRYDQETVISLGVSGSFPIGNYDASQALNLGSNIFKVHLSAPMVQSLSPWIPGKRMSLDVKPSITFFGTNSVEGVELKQDPMFVIEAHFTRDIDRRSFISLDYSFLHGGKTTLTHEQSGMVVGGNDAMSVHLLGATINFILNDNMQIFITHLQSITQESQKAVALQGGVTKITLTYGWHDVIQQIIDFYNE